MFGATNTPFGGGFGSSTNTFGQQSTPFASSSGGLFGSKTPAAGAFGTPGFTSTTPASGGLFGNTSLNNNLFGAKTTQPSTGFGLGSTGTSNAGGMFGGGSSSLFQTPQSNTNAFGAKSSSFGGFGTNASAFGTSAASTGSMFGGGSTVFGQTATNGTTVKFVPVTSSESSQKNGHTGNVQTKNQCITIMDQYKDKSVEELRFEDYAAGRKGGAASSAFGATALTGGLFGSSTANTGTSLFGTNSTSKPAGFGGFGTNTSTGGLFGGQSGGGLFGAKTTQSLFGNTTTTTQSGFGGFGSSTGGLFGNTGNAGTSLFGGTATTQSGGLFGSTGFGTSTGTSGSLFGGTSAFGQPAASSTSLFGAASKPSLGFGTSSGTGFGSTGTFGSASSGGLFGGIQAKPALSFGGLGNTSTSGFGGFGGTTTSNSGGLFGNTSGSLFGSKPSGFGTTGFGGSAGTTGSLFGGSTFGTGSTGLGFGSTQGSGLGMSGANLGGLSNVDQNTLSAFRQQQIIQQQLKAIANTPFGDSPLFRNLSDSGTTKKTQTTTGLIAKEPLATSQYKVLSRPAAKVKPRPIASPSLGKSRLFDGLEDEGDFSPHPLQPRRSIKKLVIKNKTTEDSESSYGSSQLKLRSFNDDDDLIAPSPIVLKVKSTGDPPLSKLSTSPPFDNTLAELNAQQQTPKFMKASNYVLTPFSKSVQEEKEDDVLGEESGNEEELPACKIVLRRPEYYVKPSISFLNNKVVDGQCLVQDFTVGREGYGEVKFLGITNVFGLNLDKIVFFRRREAEVYPDDYPNKPEVGQELNKPSEITLFKIWPNDKSSHTPVKTPERLKASGFIDRIEEKTLAMDAVFVDYRPTEGAWVFKVNHFTRYGMQEEFIGEAIDIEKQKRILREKYLQQDNIDFQKEPTLTNDEVRMKIKQKLSSLKKTFEEHDSMSAAENETDITGEDSEYENQMEDEVVEADNMATDFTTIDDMEQPMEDDFIPMSHQLGRVARIKPFNIQGMKTSVLYDDDNDEEEDENKNVATPKTLLRSKQLFSNKSIFSNTFVQPQSQQSPFPKLNKSSMQQKETSESLNSSIFLNITNDNDYDGERVKVRKKTHLFKSGMFSQKSFAESQPDQPRKENLCEDNLFIKCRSHAMVPYEKSLIFGKTSLLADAALLHSREFHVRWNNQLTFIHTGQSIGNITQHTKKQTANIFSSNFLHSSSLLGLHDNNIHIEMLQQAGINDGVKQYIQECLELSLKYAEFEDGEDSILKKIKLQSPVQSISEFAHKAKIFTDATVGANAEVFELHTRVWDLVSALWGKQETDNSGTLYEVHAARREALSKWLSTSVAEDIKKEIEQNRVNDDGHLSVIFSFLSGNNIPAACDIARKNKEIRLAFLLSQSAGDHHLKHYIRSQLDQWDEKNIDIFISQNRLKLYTLLSGMMVWKSTNSFINVCEDLNWKRCLALHLWFYCSSTATIADVFTEYQNSFKGTDTYEPYSAFPLPRYEELNQENQAKDICYHLIALYCKRSHSLGKTLTPKTYTSNPLDYHLSWHLHQVLDELGYNHMSDERHSFLQHNYASQLENIGLWHWAIYVLMHLKDDSRREYYVKDVLCRYCHLNEENSLALTTQEKLLVNKFQVPIEWLHEAKALHAKYEGEYHAEAVHLIRAGLWNEAHNVILEHVAADSIIEEDYQSLKDLLQDLSLPERCCTVKHWKIGGQIFLDFILLKEKLQNIKSNKNSMNSYHLEDMEAEIASLINRISLMNVKTSRERLAQSEMARTCTNMLKIIYSLLNSDDDENAVEDDDENPKWSSMKVAPYVVELPLPPDYYLKELRELLANFANEIESNDT